MKAVDAFRIPDFFHDPRFIMTAFSIGRSILVLSCIGGLAGCASTDDSSTGSAQGFQQAAAACLAATGRSEMMALHVPAALRQTTRYRAGWRWPHSGWAAVRRASPCW